MIKKNNIIIAIILIIGLIFDMKINVNASSLENDKKIDTEILELKTKSENDLNNELKNENNIDNELEENLNFNEPMYISNVQDREDNDAIEISDNILNNSVSTNQSTKSFYKWGIYSVKNVYDLKHVGSGTWETKGNLLWCNSAYSYKISKDGYVYGTEYNGTVRLPMTAYYFGHYTRSGDKLYFSQGKKSAYNTGPGGTQLCYDIYAKTMFKTIKTDEGIDEENLYGDIYTVIQKPVKGNKIGYTTSTNPIQYPNNGVSDGKYYVLENTYNITTPKEPITIGKDSGNIEETVKDSITDLPPGSVVTVENVPDRSAFIPELEDLSVRQGDKVDLSKSIKNINENIVINEKTSVDTNKVGKQVGVVTITNKEENFDIDVKITYEGNTIDLKVPIRFPEESKDYSVNVTVNSYDTNLPNTGNLGGAIIPTAIISTLAYVTTFVEIRRKR